MFGRIWNALAAGAYKAVNGLLAPLFALVDVLFRWALGTAPVFYVDVVATSNVAGTYANGTSGVGATLTKSSAGAFPSTDGVTTPVLGMFVLLTAQSTPAQNGLYTLTRVGSSSVAWQLTRWAGQSTPLVIPAWNTSATILPGSAFYVNNAHTPGQESSHGGQVWAYTGDASPTVGTDALTFAQDSILRSTIAATVSAVQSFADGTLKLWNSGATYRATLKTAASANRTQTTADATGTLPIITSGTGVIRVGQVTLEAGTATVTDAQTTANTRVLLTPYGTPSPGAGNLTNTYGHVSNSAGASFVVRANLEDGTINNLDTSTLNYIAIG